MPLNPFPALAHDDAVLVLDGGLATELERRGHDLSDLLWSARLLIEAPDEIVATHLAYFRAGARVATTASYQATFERFAERGIGRVEAQDVLRRSIALAAEARALYRAEVLAVGHEPGPLWVAASVGPYGAMLADGSEYHGDYGLTVGQLRDFHRPRLAILAEGEADVLALETIPSLDEAQALVELLEEAPGPPAWLSFTCGNGSRTRRGEPIEAAFALADASPRVVAVGVNCTAPRHVEELVVRARATAGKPIVVYPNGGAGWDAADRRWLEQPGLAVNAESAASWVAAGARLVGGCCRVGPDQIGEIAAALA